ncbi:MAG: helix-turn-helix domain-containing protein, partial [Alphaproteobacteria bacterium]
MGRSVTYKAPSSQNIWYYPCETRHPAVFRGSGSRLERVRRTIPFRTGQIAMTNEQRPKLESGQVTRRMAALRRHLHDGMPLAGIAADAGVSLRTLQRWLTRYLVDGPIGLGRPQRPETGTRTFPKQMVELIEGMALTKPPDSIATIHRRIGRVASERG